VKKELTLRKLTLNRETLQSLDTQDLQAVAGGATVATSCGVPRTCTC
jgi:natural product precursor